MTQLTIIISNPQDASLIKKLLAKFDSVTFSKTSGQRRTGLDEALEDVANGNVTRYNSVEDFFQEMGV